MYSTLVVQLNNMQMSPSVLEQLKYVDYLFVKQQNEKNNIFNEFAANHRYQILNNCGQEVS